MRVRKWPVIGLVLAVLWLFVRGVEPAPRAVAGELLIGLAVGLPVAYVARRLYRPEIDVARSLRVTPLFGYYVLVFLKEVATANLDVAYRVLHPAMPIEPDVVEIPLRVETDAAITTIANSITLTPGTLTMDHDPETNTLYVHGIIGRRREAVVAPIRRWEDLLLVIFDEDATPDAVPPPPPDRRAPVADSTDEAAAADAEDPTTDDDPTDDEAAADADPTTDDGDASRTGATTDDPDEGGDRGGR